VLDLEEEIMVVVSMEAQEEEEVVLEMEATVVRLLVEMVVGTKTIDPKYQTLLTTYLTIPCSLSVPSAVSTR
jgi:hypothetical protein